MNSQNIKGFTLIELLIVLALIAILASILIVIIKPQVIFQNARNSQRSGDLRNLDSALIAYITDRSQTGQTIVLDNSNNTTCVGGIASDTIFSSVGISGAGPTGWWVIGTTSQAIDGSGWLPINFQNVAVLQLAQLPRDPLNTLNPSYYYSYACATDFSYEFNTRLEGSANVAMNDGGDNNALYEVGSRKNILPVTTGTNFYANW